VRRSRPDPGDAAACERAGLELLARREHSRRELERKLAARGFAPEVVAAVLADLEESGALKDARFAESFVRARAARGQGPERIRAELRERGVADARAEEALAAADVDWLATARAVRAKRFGAEPPRDYAERARQARFLQYRGFDGAQIRAALEFEADSD
jgi:regulatory protein